MSSVQKWLLVWSAGVILLAEVIKRIPLNERVTLLVAIVEVFLAIITGIAFGLASTRGKEPVD